MATLCAGTPKISVRDNRGLDVRALRYNRDVDGTVATQYVDAQTHDVLGRPATSQDPRFFGNQKLNFEYTSALSGQILATVSADAGTSEACADIAGQPVWQHSQGRDANLQSDKDISVLLSYDALGRPVQRACYTADVAGGGAQGGLTDIWSYGDYSGPPDTTYDPTDTTDSRNANQRGQVLRHFDTAGLIDMSVLGYAVQGTALRQDRRFQATPCDATSHWKTGAPQALYGLNKGWLEPDTDPANLYSTQWTYSALGQVLTQTDAKGHQQQTAYDCVGRKNTASVMPNGGTLTPVCSGTTYTAAGAIATRSDANNIQVAYVYEPQTTQRLISLTASRSAAAGNDSKSHRAKRVRTSITALQAQTYTYDGVGNVVGLSDSSASAKVIFFRNRAVTPDRGYTYDALYQLTSASGRENYVNNAPKGTDWPGAQFNPATTPEYQAYTRSYTYDLGGNLTKIGSSNWSAATPPTRQLAVSNTSNRAVSTANNAGATQANIDTYFDPAGKSIYLDANRNQPMYWTAFHQLYCVVTTYRAPTPRAGTGMGTGTGTDTGTDTGTGTGTGDWSNSDREQYAYDGSGQRVRKYASSQASNQAGGIWNVLDTRYLPGLELRSNTASGENLEVIVLDDGARVLNWAGGARKPSDIPNLQLRYQYSDRQNSCQIETDSAGNVITHEEYYPYGGTAVLASRSNSEVKYKYIHYCGKERDATGLYYYGLRYYQPWIGRWLNPDPAGTVEGQNLYRMVGNSPVTYLDPNGLKSDQENETSSDGELDDTEGELDDTDGELEDSQGDLEADHLDSGIDWVPILAYWHESPSHPLDRAYDDETTKMVGHSNADLWTRTTTFVTERWGSESKDRQLAALYEISGAKTRTWDKEIDEMKKTLDSNEANLSRGRAEELVSSYGESTEVTIFQATIELVESVVSSLSALPNQSAIQQAHASGSTRAVDDTALRRRMAYVKDNLLHLRVEAASKDGARWLNVVSKDPQRPEHLFDNWFSNKKIRKDIAFRYQKTRDYFSTDAALHQILLSKDAGLDLSQITTLQCHNVANLNTLETTSRFLGEFRETRDFQQTALPFLPGFYERRTSDEMRDAFLLTTEVGRSNKRIIDSMNAAGILDDEQQIAIDAVWRMDYAPPPIPGIAPISSPVNPDALKTDFFLILKHSPKLPALEPRGRKRPYPQDQA